MRSDIFDRFVRRPLVVALLFASPVISSAQVRVNPTAATSGVDVDVDVDDNLEADVKRGAEETADAAKRGAQKTKEGAKKVGEELKDVFTDDDRDSDKDGK